MAGSSSYPANDYNINTDIYMVDDIDDLLLDVMNLIEEINDEVYEDMQTIDDMQSKFLDVKCDEISEVRSALDSISDMVKLNKENNTKIYQELSSLDAKSRGL